MRTRLLAAAAAAFVVAAAAVGVSLASSSASSAEPAGPVLFADYFNSSQDANWTFFNRYGHIDGGRLWIDGEYTPDSIDRDGWALTHIGDRAWTDYVVEATYDNENVGGSPDHHLGDILFRVASQDGNAVGTHYRVFIWNPGDIYEGGNCGVIYEPLPTGWVQLFKFVDGNAEFLAESCGDSNTTIGTNAVRVIVMGNTIEVVSNGKTVLTYRDRTNPIKYGGVGVSQIWETNGWYDNVVVRALDDQNEQ